MKDFKFVGIFALALFIGCSCIMAFEPFSLEPLTKSDEWDKGKQKINRNFDRLTERDRTQTARLDSNYTWRDTTTVAADGDTIVYLPFKYENSLFHISIVPMGCNLFAAVSDITDSSFLLQLTDNSCAAVGNTQIRWQATGIKKVE